MFPIKELYKKLLIILMLVISPMIFVAIGCCIYVAINMILGIPFVTAFDTFMAMVFSLKPYFPYLTMIPAALVMLSLVIKKRLNRQKS